LICSKIIELYENIVRDNDIVLALIIAYIEHGCIGRRRLSRILGLTERVARRIIDKLSSIGVLNKDLEICINPGFLNKYIEPIGLKTIDTGEYKLTMINSDLELFKTIEDHLLDYRDYIVISTGKPDSIYIIGFIVNGELKIPRTPLEYIEEIKKQIPREVFNGNKVFIVWRNYRKYHSEASLLKATYKICTTPGLYKSSS